MTETVMFMQRHKISPELLISIVPSLTIETLKECVKHSVEYGTTKDYRDLDEEIKKTLYGQLQKVQVLKKETSQKRYIIHNYDEWFNECHGIHYTCAFVIAKYICKNYTHVIFKDEIKALRKGTKEMSTFFEFLTEKKLDTVIELFSKETGIEKEKLKTIVKALKTDDTDN